MSKKNSGSTKKKQTPRYINLGGRCRNLGKSQLSRVPECLVTPLEKLVRLIDQGIDYLSIEEADAFKSLIQNDDAVQFIEHILSLPTDQRVEDFADTDTLTSLVTLHENTSVYNNNHPSESIIHTEAEKESNSPHPSLLPPEAQPADESISPGVQSVHPLQEEDLSDIHPKSNPISQTDNEIPPIQKVQSVHPFQGKDLNNSSKRQEPISVQNSVQSTQFVNSTDEDPPYAPPHVSPDIVSGQNEVILKTLFRTWRSLAMQHCETPWEFEVPLAEIYDVGFSKVIEGFAFTHYLSALEGECVKGAGGAFLALIGHGHIGTTINGRKVSGLTFSMNRNSHPLPSIRTCPPMWKQDHPSPTHRGSPQPTNNKMPHSSPGIPPIHPGTILTRNHRENPGGILSRLWKRT